MHAHSFTCLREALFAPCLLLVLIKSCIESTCNVMLSNHFCQADMVIIWKIMYEEILSGKLMYVITCSLSNTM